MTRHRLDHLEEAKALLAEAHSIGDWSGDAMSPRDKWAIGQLTLASLAHAVVAFSASLEAEVARDTAAAKPPEPKGLGAVVEAIYGNHFVRIGDGREPWQHVGSGGSRCEWSAIAVVKVLSLGVTA